MPSRRFPPRPGLSKKRKNGCRREALCTTMHHCQNLRLVISGQRIRDCLVLVTRLDISCFFLPVTIPTRVLVLIGLNDVLNIKDSRTDLEEPSFSRQWGDSRSIQKGLAPTGK